MDAPNDTASVRRALDGSSISTYALCMIFVPLKIACRLSGGKGTLGWDDWCAIMALGLANAFFYTQLVGIRPMIGHDVDEYSIPQLIQFLKYVYALQILYATSIGMIKASLLCLFWRLFSVRNRVPLIIAAGIVLAWTIATNLVLILTCRPVAAQWDLTIPPSQVKCLNRKPVYIAPSSVNVVTDIMLLVLPVPYVWGLHARLGQRLILIGIFLLGTFVAVVSIVRLSIFIGLNLGDANVTSTLSEVFIWSSVEINVGLICACLPSLRPAVQWLGLSKLFGPSRGTNSRPNGNSGPSPYYGSSDRERTQQSQKKKGGFLSTLTGQMDEEEDSFQMITQHNDVRGKTDTNIDVARTSSDTDFDSQRGVITAVPAIKVHRQFDISVDSRSLGGR